MKFIVEKGSKKRIKKTTRLQRTWALKILVCPWRKISVMLHTLHSVQAIFFFLISDNWLTGNSVILSWKLKKKGKKGNMEQLPACYFNS